MKFRVFDKRYGRYLEQFRIDNMIWNALKQSDFKLERFTGIRCNDGYDVYEGDILTDDYENYLVKWDEEDLRWIMESKSVSQSLTAIRSDDEFRVVGNINENGELLK